ncbi:hypothetical protein CSPX01_14904 [Colletotrichum filicis]|nr:hypothetical protein CSPX01_14904 [Colletotrichum filicis]
MARGPDDPYPYELLASSRCPPKPRGRTRQGGMGPWSTCLPWESNRPGCHAVFACQMELTAWQSCTLASADTAEASPLLHCLWWFS